MGYYEPTVFACYLHQYRESDNSDRERKFFLDTETGKKVEISKKKNAYDKGSFSAFLGCS